MSNFKIFEIKMKYLDMVMSKEPVCSCSWIINAPWANKQHIHVCQNNLKPLIKICLENLASNMDYYLHAINSKVIPTLQFKFLQQASDILMAMLSTPNKIVPLKPAIFMINSHLRKVNLDAFSPEDVDAILEKLKTTSLRITDLSVRHNLSHEQVIELVDVLPPTIESLELTKCSDVVVKKIMRKCPALRKLNLSGCLAITDRCIEILVQNDGSEINGKNTLLEVLNVRGTSVTSRGCAFALDNIPNLSVLSSHKLVSSLCSNFISGIYNLKTLISGARSSERYLKLCSVMCPYITKMVLVRPISQNELDACVLFTNLEDATFLCCPQCDISLFLKARGRNLRNLTVDGPSMHISLKTLLENCSKLKTLRLIFITLRDVEVVTDSNYAMNSLEEVYFKKVSLRFTAGLTIDIKLRSNLPYRLLFKRSCFISLEEFIDAIIRCTCINQLQEHGIDYPYVLPSLSQMLYATTPSIEVISFCNPICS